MNVLDDLDIVEGKLLTSLFELESSGGSTAKMKDIEGAIDHIRAAKVLLNLE